MEYNYLLYILLLVLLLILSSLFINIDKNLIEGNDHDKKKIIEEIEKNNREKNFYIINDFIRDMMTPEAFRLFRLVDFEKMLTQIKSTSQLTGLQLSGIPQGTLIKNIVTKYY